MCWAPSHVAMEWDLEWFLYSTSNLSVLEIFDPLSGCLNLVTSSKQFLYQCIRIHTFIAKVLIAAITSKDPPSTRLFSSVGSYSQIAVAVSTAAILVIWDMTSTLPKLTTCPRHLDLHENLKTLMKEEKTHSSWFSVLLHSRRPRDSCIFWIVSQVVVLFEALSRVTVYN